MYSTPKGLRKTRGMQSNLHPYHKNAPLPGRMGGGLLAGVLLLSGLVAALTPTAQAQTGDASPAPLIPLRDGGGRLALPPPSDPAQAIADRFDGIIQPNDGDETYAQQMRHEAFPNGQIDSETYAAALRQIARMPVAKATAAQTTSKGGAGNPDNISVAQAGGGGGTTTPPVLTKWTFFGPVKLPVPVNAGYGPVGSYLSGRVNAVAYHPRVKNVAYLTGAQGGVWKTFDSGKNWTPLGDKWPNLSAGPIAIDPINPSNVYVGLGDFKGARGFQSDAKIMYSPDASATWRALVPRDLAGAAVMTNQCVSSIIVDPKDPRILVVSTGRGSAPGGLYRSVDRGVTWTDVTPAADLKGDWSQVALSQPDNNGLRRYYASRIGQGVFRSIDQGATWTKLPVPLAFNNPTAPAGGLGLQIGASRVFPNVLYVIDASGAKGSLDGRVFKTSDFGATWVDLSGNYPTTAGGYNNFAKADFALHITPVFSVDSNGTATDMVYSGGLTLGATPTGQANWTDIAFTLTPGARTHNDQHGADGDPFNPLKALIANSGGIYGVTYDLARKDWVFDGTLNATLGLTQFNAADWSLTSANVSVGGAQDNGVPSSSGDPTVLWKNNGGGDGGGVGFSVSDPNLQYATYSTLGRKGIVIRTTDAWTTSSEIGPDWTDTNQVAPVSTPPQIGVLAVSQALNYPAGQKDQVLNFNSGPQLGNFNFQYNYGPAQPTEGYVFYGTQYVFRYNGGDWLRDTGTPPKVKAMGGTQLTTGFITALAVSSTPLLDVQGNIVIPRGNILYAGTSDGAVWICINPLDPDRNANPPPPEKIIHWFRIGAAQLPANQAITSIALNPNNPGDILVTLGDPPTGTNIGAGRVYRCGNTIGPAPRFTDQSGFGASRLPEIRANAITRDSADPENIYYVATDLGVFLTRDGGSSWSDYGAANGLPNVPCTAIKATNRPSNVAGGPGLLHVATYGRGLWRISLPDAAVPDIQVRITAQRLTSGVMQIAVTLVNQGGQANNVEIRDVTLKLDRGSATTFRPTNANFPDVAQGIGGLPAGGVRQLIYNFDGNALPTGSGATIAVKLFYTGGAEFIRPTRTRLP